MNPENSIPRLANSQTTRTMRFAAIRPAEDGKPWTILHGSTCIAFVFNGNMAKRVCNALNSYHPDRRGQ